MRLSLIIISSVLILDQFLKIWIKTHFLLGEDYKIFDWFYLHFTENPGMAFGFEFGGNIGKYFLSVFRIIFSIVGFVYLYKFSKQGVHKGIIISGSLVLAGAVGNVIDSAVYGLIFTDSLFQISQQVPFGTGYAGFLQGHVVDMLYFPVIDTHFPSWFPFWGGEHFLFFRPVFNVADASISCGIALFLLFQKKWMPKEEEEVIKSEE